MNLIYSTAGGSWWSPGSDTMEQYYKMRWNAHEGFGTLRSWHLAQYGKWKADQDKGHVYCVDLSKADSDKKTIVAEP